MTDVIFFINSALEVVGRSVFSNEERWEQTLGTIESIDKYCPNNKKYLYDNSANIISQEKVDELSKRGVSVLWLGKNPLIHQISSDISFHGIGNSIAETLSTAIFMDWFKDQNVTAKRMCKVSGRYKLNENFNYSNPEFKDKYVFLKAKPPTSHLSEHYGLTKLLCTRCWHMDFSLLPEFQKDIIKIHKDCVNMHIDAEHSYYKNIPKDKLYEVEKVGLEGNVAPNGEYAND